MSEASEVLARKYRPKRFDDLIGQTTIAQTLSLALDSKRLSHAYLFSGLRGSGKTSTARIFSKALVCEQGPTSRPCDQCTHCQMANEGRHIDIVEMDAASSRKIDDIRDLIEQTKYKPASARFKIFIVDEVHMLTKEAFNALLKTLEEPPSYVKFILATTDPLKLPATILSRTQHFRFKRIPDSDIINHLSHILNIEQIGFEPAALTILARSGNGSLRDTLTLLDQAIIYSKNFVDVTTVTDMLGLIDPNFMRDMFGAVFARDTASLLNYIKQLADYEAEMVIDELIAFLKERLFAQDDINFSNLIIERFFRILSESKSLISINAEGSFVLTLLLFKMMESLKIKEIDEMIASLEADVAQHPMPAAPRQVQAAPVVSHAEETTAPTQQPVEEPVAAVAPPKSEGELLFEKLAAKVMDRNLQLGQCFAEGFSLVSFSRPLLHLQICAEDSCLQELRSHYKTIIHPFINEIFGPETDVKVDNVPYEKKNPEILEASADNPTEAPVTPVPQIKEPETQPLRHQDEDPNGSGSCVVGCEEKPATPETPEFDQGAILQDPMVQKAIELFGNKVTIQNKI